MQSAAADPSGHRDVPCPGYRAKGSGNRMSLGNPPKRADRGPEGPRKAHGYGAWPADASRRRSCRARVRNRCWNRSPTQGLGWTHRGLCRRRRPASSHRRRACRRQKTQAARAGRTRTGHLPRPRDRSASTRRPSPRKRVPGRPFASGIVRLRSPRRPSRRRSSRLQRHPCASGVLRGLRLELCMHRARSPQAGRKKRDSSRICQWIPACSEWIVGRDRGRPARSVRVGLRARSERDRRLAVRTKGSLRHGGSR